MNMIEAVKSAFSNYVNFKDRARRSEYWYFTLFNILVSIATSVIDIFVLGFDAEGFLPLNTIFGLATLLPGIAVSVRRLHDIGKSGWWLLIIFTIIGIIPLIYWYCQPSTPGPNEYGQQPA